jgi:hypothetical protein
MRKLILIAALVGAVVATAAGPASGSARWVECGTVRHSGGVKPAPKNVLFGSCGTATQKFSWAPRLRERG